MRCAGNIQREEGLGPSFTLSDWPGRSNWLGCQSSSECMPRMPGPTCKWLSEPRRFVNVPHGVADIRRSLIVVLPRRAVLPTGWGGGGGGGDRAGPHRASVTVKKKIVPVPARSWKNPHTKWRKELTCFEGGGTGRRQGKKNIHFRHPWTIGHPPKHQKTWVSTILIPIPFEPQTVAQDWSTLNP